MTDPRPWEPYENSFCFCSDLELAEAYVQYMDNPGSMYFSEIFWEANRRGLSLDDLEQIYSVENPPLSPTDQ